MRLIAMATAMFVGLSCAHAQVGGMGALTPNAGMGTTSPLGMSTSGTTVAPTGIPLGAAPLATPGVTSGTSNGVASATACSSPGMGAMTSSGMGSTALFEWRGTYDGRDAARLSGPGHDRVWRSFPGSQRHILAVEHFDACEFAAGRADDSDRLDRAEQSGSQPGPVSGDGQYRAVNVFRCLLMRKRLQGSMQCDAR